MQYSSMEMQHAYLISTQRVAGLADQAIDGYPGRCTGIHALRQLHHALCDARVPEHLGKWRRSLISPAMPEGGGSGQGLLCPAMVTALRMSPSVPCSVLLHPGCTLAAPACMGCKIFCWIGPICCATLRSVSGIRTSTVSGRHAVVGRSTITPSVKEGATARRCSMEFAAASPRRPGRRATAASSATAC